MPSACIDPEGWAGTSIKENLKFLVEMEVEVGEAQDDSLTLCPPRTARTWLWAVPNPAGSPVQTGTVSKASSDVFSMQGLKHSVDKV